MGYTLMNDEPTDIAPKLIRVVETDVPQSLLTSPVSVTVRMSVDPHGVPENITMEKSAGAVLDQKTLAAVSQFRFKPAMVNHRAVQSEVTVDIKVEKQ
jgi:TonB family protein